MSTTISAFFPHPPRCSRTQAQLRRMRPEGSWRDFTCPSPRVSLITPQEIAGITGSRVRDGGSHRPCPPSGVPVRLSRAMAAGSNVASGQMERQDLCKGSWSRRPPDGDPQADVSGGATLSSNVRVHVHIGTQSAGSVGLLRNDQGNPTTKAHISRLRSLVRQVSLTLPHNCGPYQ